MRRQPPQHQNTTIAIACTTLLAAAAGANAKPAIKGQEILALFLYRVGSGAGPQWGAAAGAVVQTNAVTVAIQYEGGPQRRRPR